MGRTVLKVFMGMALWITLILLYLCMANVVLAAESDRMYDPKIFEMSEEGFYDVARVVEAEARGESLRGHEAVVEVIANRAINPNHYKDTMPGVVAEKGQFSTYKRRNKVKVMSTTLEAIEAVKNSTASVLECEIADGKLNGTVDGWVEPKDYVYFCTPAAYKKKGHRYMHNIIQIGGHVFGTMKGEG